MIQLEALSKNEKFIVAEYIYSFLQDILIKSDLERLLLVLENHGIKIESKNPSDVYDLIRELIPERDIKKLMSQYYNLELQ